MKRIVFLAAVCLFCPAFAANSPFEFIEEGNSWSSGALSFSSNLNFDTGREKLNFDGDHSLGLNFQEDGLNFSSSWTWFSSSSIKDGLSFMRFDDSYEVDLSYQTEGLNVYAGYSAAGDSTPASGIQVSGAETLNAGATLDIGEASLSLEQTTIEKSGEFMHSRGLTLGNESWRIGYFDTDKKDFRTSLPTRSNEVRQANVSDAFGYFAGFKEGDVEMNASATRIGDVAFEQKVDVSYDGFSGAMFTHREDEGFVSYTDIELKMGDIFLTSSSLRSNNAARLQRYRGSFKKESAVLDSFSSLSLNYDADAQLDVERHQALGDTIWLGRADYDFGPGLQIRLADFEGGAWYDASLTNDRWSIGAVGDSGDNAAYFGRYSADAYALEYGVDGEEEYFLLDASRNFGRLNIDASLEMGQRQHINYGVGYEAENWALSYRRTGSDARTSARRANYNFVGSILDAFDFAHGDPYSLRQPNSYRHGHAVDARYRDFVINWASYDSTGGTTYDFYEIKYDADLLLFGVGRWEHGKLTSEYYEIGYTPASSEYFSLNFYYRFGDMDRRSPVKINSGRTLRLDLDWRF